MYVYVDAVSLEIWRVLPDLVGNDSYRHDLFSLVFIEPDMVVVSWWQWVGVRYDVEKGRYGYTVHVLTGEYYAVSAFGGMSGRHKSIIHSGEMMAGVGILWS